MYAFSVLECINRCLEKAFVVLNRGIQAVAEKLRKYTSVWELGKSHK